MQYRKYIRYGGKCGQLHEGNRQAIQMYNLNRGLSELAVDYPPSSVAGRVRFEWIEEAWRCYRAAPGVWILTVTVAGLINFAVFIACNIAFGLWSHISVVLQIVLRSLSSGDTSSAVSALAPLDSLNRLPGYWATQLVGLVVAAYLYAGLQRMANDQVRGKQISSAMMFSGGVVFDQYLIYTLIASIVDYVNMATPNDSLVSHVLGFVGVLVYILVVPGYAMVADGVAAIPAIRASAIAAWRNLPMGIAFYLVFLAIVGISAIPCGLGLTVTTPMITIIFSLAYRDLIGMRSQSDVAPDR